ncbi:MAG: hypothetical protein PF630_08565 [Gammaproteobacteria bacterium]|jgi:hypothetical protein|nr:hypothetical protein [Gammaproteobacteria bacterium]
MQFRPLIKLLVLGTIMSSSAHGVANETMAGPIRSMPAQQIASTVPAEGPTVRYFRVAEINKPCFHCESFILPLSDPDDIAQAENLIENGPESGGTIAVSQIVAGSDGINRDLNAPDEPLWSWHIVSFDGFSDITIELCDGWPSLIESDVDEFIRNTSGPLQPGRGQICFWGWTVVDEVRGSGTFAVPALSSFWILLLALSLGTAGLLAMRGTR